MVTFYVKRRPPEPEALRWQVIGTQKSAVGKLCRHCQAWVLTILAVVSACFVLLVSRNYLGEYWGGAFLLVTSFCVCLSDIIVRCNVCILPHDFFLHRLT